MASIPETLTPEEAARYLRVNPQTLYRLLRSGRLPGVKVGRQWRIRKATLEAYLDGGAGPGHARTGRSPGHGRATPANRGVGPDTRLRTRLGADDPVGVPCSLHPGLRRLRPRSWAVAPVS